MRRAARCAGGIPLALLALLGLGGAASRPGGFLIGLPHASQAVLGLAALALLAVVTKGAGLAPVLGLAVPAVLLLAGLHLPGVAALSGPPLLALALAGGAVLLAQARPRISRAIFFPAVLVLYVVVAGRVQIQVGPQGDEPHYLMVAESLLRDHDLSLEKDYAEARYLAFHDFPLEPHYRVRGRGGEIYSLHAVGLSLLILPAYALGGYSGASLFMALLAAAVAFEIRELVRAGSGNDGLAEGVGWAVALSPPLIHYVGLVFTEVPAALAVAFALRRLRWGSAGAALAVGLVLACLPWLNVRYALLGAILLAYGLLVRPGLGERVALVAPVAASTVGIAAYHFILYGFFSPSRVYGRRPEFSLGTLPEGLPGLLLDQEFGLLVYAPVFALALPGFIQHWRKDRRESLVVLALVGAVFLTAGTWHMWRGGWNPPARFLVPLVPVLALLVHRDRDGTAPLFRAASGAEEWTRLLPGYVLADPDRHRLALVWGLALLAALPWRARAPTAGRMALTTLGLLAAAGAASSLSHAKSGGRDAVRLVDRPTLAVPGWSIEPARPARWGPEALEWGPLFETHRHPEGVAIGERLPIPPGRCRLRLEGEALGPLPNLEIQPDRPGSPWRFAGREGDPWTVEVYETDGPVTLRLRGGGPFLLRAAELRLQPEMP